MTARKAPRKSPPGAAGTRGDDTSGATPPRSDATAKVAKPPRKRRPRFVL